MGDFSNWVLERNIILLILGVVIFEIVDRLAKNIHQDVLSPVVEKCSGLAGLRRSELAKMSRTKRVLLHLVEFAISIVIIYFISKMLLRWVAKHEQKRMYGSSSNATKDGIVVDMECTQPTCTPHKASATAAPCPAASTG